MIYLQEQEMDQAGRNVKQEIREKILSALSTTREAVVGERPCCRTQQSLFWDDHTSFPSGTCKDNLSMQLHSYSTTGKAGGWSRAQGQLFNDRTLHYGFPVKIHHD